MLKNKRKKQAKKISEKNKQYKASRIKQTKKTVENKEKIVEFIRKNGTSKTSEIAKLLNLSEARARAILKELIVEEKISASGGTKGKIYFLAK